MTKVTYKHQPGDPEIIEWRGHTFKSGEAVDVGDGRKSEVSEVVEAAKANPWFSVEGSDDKDKGASGGGQRQPDEPETAEQYRAYALKWINSPQNSSSKAMEQRWKAEEPRRERAGFGSDDQALIDPFYNPKLENLKKAERAQN